VASVWVFCNARYVRADQWVIPDKSDKDGWWAQRSSLTQEFLERVYEPTHWMPMPELPGELDGYQPMLDRAALDDAIDHHDGGKPIPLPRDVADRLRKRGFDLSGIPLEGTDR